MGSEWRNHSDAVNMLLTHQSVNNIFSLSHPPSVEGVGNPLWGFLLYPRPPSPLESQKQGGSALGFLQRFLAPEKSPMGISCEIGGGVIY